MNSEKITVGLILLIVMNMANAAVPGGISDDTKQPDDKVNGVVKEVSSSIKSQAMASLTQSGGNADANAFNNSAIEVLGYKTQVVAGTNYFVKFRLANLVFQAKIYKPISGKTSLAKVIGPMNENDPINYF